jgi:hypothetical protein
MSRGFRRKARTTMLLQSQIEQAMKVTRSNKAAAEYLRVGYPLYKRFAMLYKTREGVSLFHAHRNQAGKGISKIGTSTSRSTLDDILLGKHPTYPRYKLLPRLIVNGYFAEQCTNCGFCQRRPTDLKVPLVLHHINGSIKDHRIDNLDILCYNCYFVNVGNLSKTQMRVDAVEAPERTIDASLMEDEDSLQALSTMDILTEEEKLKIMEDLRNSFE